MQRKNAALAIAALILGLAGTVRASDAIVYVSGTPEEYGSVANTFDAGDTTAKANWADTNKWSNGVLPGVNDDVVIARGECSVSNSVVVKSVTVNASAKLKVESKGAGGIPARVNFQAGSLDIAAGALVAIGGTSTTAVDAQTQDTADLPAAIGVEISGGLTNAGLLSIGGRNGTNTLSVTVDADFVMADGSTTAIYAGRATNALDLVGIYRQSSPVNAAEIELQGNAVLYNENDAWSGGCIKYSCGDFIVAHDAKVDTVNRGYAFKKCAIVDEPHYPVDMPVITNVPYLYFTYGPGRSAPGAYNGAGHGGQGYGTIYTPSQTQQATGYGQAYGYRLAPYLAGSPGNIYSGPYTGSGSIVVFADRIKVDGTLSAYGGVVDGHGAPSAGGIMLVSDSFDFGPDAVVTAEGTYNKQTASGGRHGAGGRVALLCGFGTEDIATIVAGEEPAEVDVRDASNYIIAAIDAKSGRDWNLTRGSNKGTTCFARPGTLPKRLVAVRGTLGQIRAESASWGYRSRTFASGASVTLSMADTSDVLHEGNNYTFRGWELRPATNAAIVVGSGPEASVTFVLDEDSLVTWVWEKTACMMNLAAAAGGIITYNGTNYTAGSACVFNLACGAESGEITAVPDDGYEFLYWVGDIEAAKALSATTTITSVAPRDITAIFRPVAEPKARVFNAATPLSSGDWLDPARWTDGIIPGLSDSVTIASGTCVVSNYLDVKSVTVGGSANLLVADYGTSGGYAREITAKLTDGNLVVAQGGVAAFGGTTATAAGVKAQTYSTAHFPSRVSLSVAGCVTNSGSLSVGGRGGIYITNTLGVVVSSEFVMADGSVTAIYAGRAENPLSLTGLWSQASVVSASRFELLGTAVLYSENDGWSGNPVRFETDCDLTVGASARVDTISRGYNYFRVPADMSDDYPADMPYVDSSFRNFTYAPGRAPAGAYVIAAHGGGGNAPTYGWPLAAYLPGSPGNLYSTMHRGSGSIVIVADSMIIDGTLTAFGGEFNDHGSPSAGGIMLVSDSYKFSPEAIITAEGPYNKMSQMSGAYGAGGRVSILCGFGETDLATIVSGAAPGDVVIRDAFDYEFSASIDALSGKNINLKRGSNNGTTCFARPASLPVFLVAARSNNGTTGNDGMKWDGVSAGYGTRTYASGATVTLTQTATAPIVADGSVCVFAGYEAYDINDRSTPVNTGAVNAVTLTVDSDWLVVWLYNVAGFVMTVPSSDQGSIVYAGPEGDETYANGAVAEIVVLTGHETGDITADPAAGYEFLCWDGDVPFGMSAQNPIRFTSDAARTIRPVFREAQSATTRTFTAGSSTARGYWTNPSFWTPGGIPGPDDDVIINAGECVASNYIAAKSITINTDGKLKVGGHGKNIGDPVNANELSGEMNADIGNAFLPTANEILHETRVVVSGNVTLNDNGQLGIGGITPHQRWQDVSIGGNLTLNGTSVMLVSGGETNATFNHITGTAWLRIGGVFAINDTAKFVPQSERYTGGSVKVACRRFVLAADAKVDALRRGYGQYLLRDPTTLAPGGSTVVGAIAAGVYGGTGGKTYGYEYAPIHPGSPRGTYNTGFSSGGGLIRIHASSMEIAGTLDANAGDPTGADYGHGGASGGGIWLTAAQTVKYSGTPSLLARGQRAHYSAAGGGGRIAITLTPDQRIIDQLALTGTHPEVVLKSIDRTAFTNAFPNVSASADVDRSIDYSASSPDGTFSYTDLIPRGSLIWLK